MGGGRQETGGAPYLHDRVFLKGAVVVREVSEQPLALVDARVLVEVRGDELALEEGDTPILVPVVELEVDREQEGVVRDARGIFLLKQRSETTRPSRRSGPSARLLG